MNIICRKATLNDLKTLRRFSSELYKILNGYDPRINTDIGTANDGKYIKDNLAKPSHYYVIAEEGKTPVGYMLCFVKNNMPYRSFLRSELDELYITENARGKGAGALLIKEFMKWSKQAGAKSMIIEALTKNERAIRLYEKMGFVSLNTRLEKKVT